MQTRPRIGNSKLIALGALLTLAVVFADSMQILTSLERWMYDHRARWCQNFNKPPTTQIVHIDIDDSSLKETVWPWPRAYMAQVIDEISRAEPKVVGLDMFYAEKQELSDEDQTDSNDQQLAASIQRAGNVLLPISVKFQKEQNDSPIWQAMTKALHDDLELQQDEVEAILLKQGFSRDSVEYGVNLGLAAARDAMMSVRLTEEVERGDTDLASLRKKLVPRARMYDEASRLLDAEYPRIIAIKATDRFVVPANPQVRLAETFDQTVNIRELADVAKYSGFIDLLPSNDATVRSVPLLTEYRSGVMPHMVLAMACAMLDVDPKAIRYNDDEIVLPAASGPVVIPVRPEYSTTLRTVVGAMVDIPYFGKTGDWLTIYDWPAHLQAKSHLPIKLLWTMCRDSHRILRNNALADAALKDAVALGSSAAEKFTNAKPDLSDTAARVRAISETLSDLKRRGLDALLTKPRNELSDEEKDAAVVIGFLHGAEQSLGEENSENLRALQLKRAELYAMLHGKAVIISATAEGTGDLKTTSLHAVCPGGVIQGVILNGILTGQMWRQMPFWLTCLCTLIVGLLTSFIVASLTPLRAFLCTLLVMAGYAFFNGEMVFDYGHHILGLAGPISAIFVVWTGCSVARLVIEGIERVRHERDLAVFHHEVDLARRVQEALIPRQMPEINGLEPHGWTRSADVTGGDLFDLWTMPDGRLGILLADASGHGLAASIIVSQVRTIVRTLAEIEMHPEGLLARVNSRLCQDLEGDRFVTAFLGFLSPDGELQWSSAGHGPILWCSGDGTDIEMLPATALPMGAAPEFLSDEVPPLQLNASGMLIVISDGIFEATNPQGEEFGIERVVSTLQNACGKPANEMTAALRAAVQSWQVKDRPKDDQTIVIIRRVEAGVAVTMDECAEAATSS